MARYEHLPIYRAAFDLAVHIEKIVHNFSRYYKYTLGSELRNGSRGILERIIEANQSRRQQQRHQAAADQRRQPGYLRRGTNPRGVAFDGANIWVANAVSNTLSKR